MASEDVIELGSSDEDTQPAPKKAKPMPNAMVCIPNKFPGVTIKSTKSNPKSITRALGKAVTVTKMSSVMIENPYAVKTKVFGKPIQKSSVKLQAPVKIQNRTLNYPKSSISIMKIGRPQETSNIPVKNPIRITSPRTLNLPSSITVKRTVPPKQISHIVANVPRTKRKPKVSTKNVPGEVLTVELDDDEGTSSTSGPQWYLRPEEGETKKVEEENNREPKATNFIEITIEDSPIKPIPNKRTCEVGSELAITIDDSPLKSAPEKRKATSDSDNEPESTKVPHSKKKLKYPKEAENEQRETIEIEVDLIETYNNDNKINEVTEDPIKISTPGDDKMEVTFSDVHNAHTSTPKKINILKPEKPKDVILITDASEFNPAYQSFIDLCFKLENSEDMKKIVEKKIKAYYRQVPKEYTESEEFIDMVSSKVLSMKAGPEKMYLYIKDIVDELNLQRKLAKSMVVNKEPSSAETEQLVFEQESEFDAKRRRQIRKLEKTIKKLHRAIQKLEEQEVDFDDEDDSVYLLTERYKERMVRVYAKFCQMTSTKMPSEPRIQLDARPGHPAGPAKRLEKWINKKVPIGTPLPFPDFHDVLRCVRDANDEDKLGWNEVDIMEEARDLFMRCGKKLQRRRQENEWRSAASRLALDTDPAEKNDDLKKQLDENKQLATKKEIDIFNKYADRQNQLKLEAEEIGDKEAEESPVESEDEEANEGEGVSLENKEKRKERLKRLLQEKSKKEKGEEKENKPTNELDNLKIPTESTETVEKVDNAEVEKESKKLEHKDDLPKVSGEKGNREKSPVHIEEAHSISSDDSNKVESDIDELHLLQKLHSGNEAESSTLESSDSESPIAISESLESTDDGKPKQLSDVISIENSSYSETEGDKNDSIEKDIPNKSVEKLINSDIEKEYSNAGVEKVQNKTNNDEYNDTVENILLASSEDEAEEETNNSPTDSTCVNLRDEVISIDENVDNNINNKRQVNADEHLKVISIDENVDNNEREENADEHLKVISIDENVDNNERQANADEHLKVISIDENVDNNERQSNADEHLKVISIDENVDNNERQANADEHLKVISIDENVDNNERQANADEHLKVISIDENVDNNERQANADEHLKVISIDEFVDNNKCLENAGKHLNVITESNEKNIANDVSSVEENANNNIEEETNGDELIEHDTNNIDEQAVIDAVQETEPNKEQTEPMTLNEIVSIPINDIDSTESSQDVVMRVEDEVMKAVEEDCTPAKVDITSADTKSNENMEKMIVDEVENNLSKLFSDVDSSEVNDLTTSEK